MAAVSDLEGGHQDIVSSIQCLGYELDFEKIATLEEAKESLNRAFANIKEPLRVSTLQNKLNIIILLKH